MGGSFLLASRIAAFSLGDKPDQCGPQDDVLQQNTLCLFTALI
jgi:hypothetical protein